MQVSKWGNSLAVRLPRKLVETLGLKEGDDLTVIAAEDRLLSVAKVRDREAALARMAARGWKLPGDYRFDRDEANAR
jgi:antitoxin MazE